MFRSQSPAGAQTRRTPSTLYYGWAIVFVAAAAMVGTLPGRTQGLGLITEPLLADLALDRVTYAELNFWATIVGAAGAIGMGHAMDRVGGRMVLTLISLALGTVVCAMSQTTTVTGLAVWLTLTRAFGQSALSVISLAMVGHWFVRRIESAMAVYSVLMSVGFMIAFPLVGWLVQREGWRNAWLTIGVALIAGLAPAAWLVVRRSPEACGLRADGEPASDGSRKQVEPQGNEPAAPVDGHSWRTAIGTPVFWVFAAGTALYGLVASGIGLFNESILAERGFGAHIYYQSLVVTALTALVGNFLGGWLARYVNLTVLLAGSLAVLAAGVAVLPVVSAYWHVMAWAAAMGLSGGVVMVLFFSVWARVFGRRDLGRIQGAAQALTVLASALGPLLLAWSIEWSGSYTPVFRLLAGLIMCVALAGLLVSLPVPPSVPEVASSESR